MKYVYSGDKSWNEDLMEVENEKIADSDMDENDELSCDNKDEENTML